MKFRQELFWDTDANIVSIEKNASYIIERILDFGNDQEVRWMWQTYSRSRIRDVVDHSRVLHKPTRALWKLLTATP